MDNFVRCHAAVQLICSEAILPSIQKVLEDWHQRCLREYGSCIQQTCPNKGKPNPNKGFCQSCVDWGKAIENVYYPPSKTAFIKWNNADPTLFCKAPMEVAKVFVLRLQQGQVYGSLDDFDAASVLMLAMHFKPFHQGNQMVYDSLEKVLILRNELSHLNIKNNMELDNTFTIQSFNDMRDLIPFLTSPYFTQDEGDQIKLDITKIQTSAINDHMKQQALCPLSEEVKREILEMIDERITAHDSNRANLHDVPSFDIEVFRRHLKEHYLQSLCKIPKYPGDSETCLDMDEIYTNLSLHQERVKALGTIKMPLKSHHDIFTTEVNGILPKRLLVLGRGGSGKTTLFAKLAYDWATENSESPLRDLPLLIVLNLRWVQYSSNIEEAILHQLLPRHTTMTKDSIRHFIEQNPDRVMILLDSYDEFSRGDILGSTEHTGGNVVDILANQCLTSCRVLVSSRHWRRSDFSRLNNLYAKFDVEGFSEDNVKEYILKIFPESPDSGERLCQYVRNNNLLPIATNPLMAQLFCLFWKETNEEDIPNKINELYSAIFRVLYHHLLAKDKETDDMDQQVESALQELVLQLGECALSGLWPPENSLVFSYDDMVTSTSAQCVERGCKTGIISVEKGPSTYKPNQGRKHGEIHEQRSVVFFHKSAQEKCAGEYLAHLGDTNPDELEMKLSKLDTVHKCLSVQMVLRFACGSSLKSTELILRKLLDITKTELIDDIHSYYADTLTDLEKGKDVQEFTQVCLLCNYESGSTQFNHLFKVLFPSGKMQFLGLTPYTSSAVEHLLRSQEQIITKIKLIQIPTLGINCIYGTTTAMVDAFYDASFDKIKQIPTKEKIEKLCNDYKKTHQGLNDFQDARVATYFNQELSTGLALIQVWENFNKWHFSQGEMNIDTILDAVQFTKLNELSLLNIKLADAGHKLVDVMKRNHLADLTHLIVPDTGLSIDTLNEMVGILSRCTPKLQVLDISRNNAEESQVIRNLTHSLPHLPLVELKVYDMNTPSSNMTALAQVIPKFCTNLSVLHMRGNFMDNETGTTLVHTLKYLRHLKTLSIDVNGMERKTHRNIIMAMSTLLQIEKLGLNKSPYIDDLMLYLGRVMKHLSHLRWIFLDASIFLDQNVDVKVAPSLSMFLTRIRKKEIPTSETTVVKRKSWQSFMSSLQAMGRQMRRVYLWNINLHIADLREVLAFCRIYGMELRYSRRLWPEGLDIPEDVALAFF